MKTTSLQLSKRLKELGVKQDSYFWYKVGKSTGKHNLLTEKEFNGTDTAFFNYYSAFTAEELIDLLPQGYVAGNTFFREAEQEYICFKRGSKITDKCIYSDTLTNAMAEMVIFLKTNNLI